jgi:hypothetical protein
VSNVHIDRTIRSPATGECQLPSHCAPLHSNSSCWFVCGEAHVDSPEDFATAVCSLLLDDSVWSKASVSALNYAKQVRDAAHIVFHIIFHLFDFFVVHTPISPQQRIF